MNPRAAALLARSLGNRRRSAIPARNTRWAWSSPRRSRSSPRRWCGGSSARLCRVGVGSGALANLYAFMATCEPGDRIMVSRRDGRPRHPQPRRGRGALPARDPSGPYDAARMAIDLDKLRRTAKLLVPKLITWRARSASFPTTCRGVRAIADEVGAYVLYRRAAYGRHDRRRPLPGAARRGAHMMTMFTLQGLWRAASGLFLHHEANSPALDKMPIRLTANFRSRQDRRPLPMATLDSRARRRHAGHPSPTPRRSAPPSKAPGSRCMASPGAAIPRAITSPPGRQVRRRPARLAVTGEGEHPPLRHRPAAAAGRGRPQRHPHRDPGGDPLGMVGDMTTSPRLMGECGWRGRAGEGARGTSSRSASGSRDAVRAEGAAGG